MSVEGSSEISSMSDRFPLLDNWSRQFQRAIFTFLLAMSGRGCWILESVGSRDLRLFDGMNVMVASQARLVWRVFLEEGPAKSAASQPVFTPPAGHNRRIKPPYPPLSAPDLRVLKGTSWMSIL